MKFSEYGPRDQNSILALLKLLQNKLECLTLTGIFSLVYFKGFGLAAGSCHTDDSLTRLKIIDRDKTL
jgi:hypothetical protein